MFIAGGSRIGEDCVIFHHVTIGANPIPFSKNTGFPVIGDNCYLGAGATVIGAVRIGDNCRIGANCTVYNDILENSVVVSQPPRIIQRQDINNKYYKWSMDGPVYYKDGKWHLEEDPDIVNNLKTSFRIKI